MKQYFRKIPLFAIGIWFLMACAPMPIYQSQTLNASQRLPSPFVDSDSKMLYTVEHDDRFLYINLSSAGPSTQQQILMQGLSIWVDATAKKKEYLGFTYPLTDRPTERGGVDRERGNRQPQQESGSQREMSNRLFNQWQKKISYIELYGFLEEGSKERLNYRLEKGPIKVDLSMDENGQLMYNVKVPLQSIFAGNTGDGKLVSVGVMANKAEGDRPSGPPLGSGQGGRQGGPPGGGQGRGQGRQGGGRPSMQGGDDMDSSSGINFWFKVLM